MRQAQHVSAEILRLALGDPELLEIATAHIGDVFNDEYLRKVLARLSTTGRTEDVQSLTALVLASQPDHAAARFAQGINYYFQRRFTEAIPLLEAALRVDPRDTLARGYLGVSYSMDETHANLAIARDHLRQATAEAPHWTELVFTLARICTAIGPVADAARIYRQLLAVEPDNGRNHYLLAEALSDLGEYDDAKTHLARAMELGYRGSYTADADIKTIDTTPKAKKKIIRSRYPDTEDMKSDFIGVIKKTVISDLNDLPAFITPDTRFFTLGSCFARHMARALKEAGHECYHIEVGDVINTTYANFVMPRPTSINSRALAETYDFRTTRVSENVANMKFIIDAMRAINPELKIFITVSPAPLHVTFERNASVVGDCLSKSVMRVSADELMHSGYKDIHYWPSFEIVRWLSGHVGPFFGVDDGASWHISEKLIEQIIGLFLERFTPQQQIAA